VHSIIRSRIPVLLLIITVAVIHLYNPADLCETRLKNHKTTAQSTLTMCIVNNRLCTLCYKWILTCQFIRTSLKLQDMLAYSPRKSVEVCFYRRWFVLWVCLSVTTITKKIVDGFVPNFMGRFLGGKGRTSSCFVTIGRGMWK